MFVHVVVAKLSTTPTQFIFRLTKTVTYWKSLEVEANPNSRLVMCLPASKKSRPCVWTVLMFMFGYIQDMTYDIGEEKERQKTMTE